MLFSLYTRPCSCMDKKRSIASKTVPIEIPMKNKILSSDIIISIMLVERIGPRYVSSFVLHSHIMMMLD